MRARHLFTHDVRPGRLYRVPDCPDNVMLDVTWRCNLRCAFCYNPADGVRRGHPEAATLEAILRVLAGWGVQEVLYLGGEPTLHPGFDRLLELGAQLGLSQRVVTNGLRLAADRARRLRGWGVEVGVSLHGAQAEVHDRLTGARGSFARALRGLDALAAAGVAAFVQYSPTRVDREGLPALAALLGSRYGDAVRFLDVNRLLPYGEGARQGEEVFLDEDGWWGVLRAAGRLARAGGAVRVESVPRCWVRSRAAGDGLDGAAADAILACLRPCYMGVNQLALDPAGRLKLCPGGPAVGPSLLEVDPAELWRRHPLLVERRELRFLPAACVDYDAGRLCEEFYECGGGCRSAAGVVPGAADPLGPVAYESLVLSCSSSSGTTGRAVRHQSSRSRGSSAFRSSRQSSQT